MTIRKLQQDDLPAIIDRFTFAWSSKEATVEKWHNYFQEHNAHSRVVLVVIVDKVIVGYGSLLFQSKYFTNLPEISDVWIHEQFRHQGHATRLIAAFETIAREQGFDWIGIGVGLYADYGDAQKLYVKQGFVPDGNGITYKNQPVVAGKTYPIDDELILWLKKPL